MRISIRMVIKSGEIIQRYLTSVMPIMIYLTTECFLVHWLKALSHLHSLRNIFFVYGGACCSLGSDHHVTLCSFSCLLDRDGFVCLLIQLLMLFLFCVCCHLFSSSGNPLVTSAFIVENTFAIAIGAISLILFAQLIGNMQVVS